MAILVFINRLSPLSDDFVILAYLYQPWQISPPFHMNNHQKTAIITQFFHFTIGK